jgi:hypothetical protein
MGQTKLERLFLANILQVGQIKADDLSLKIESRFAKEPPHLQL